MELTVEYFRTQINKIQQMLSPTILLLSSSTTITPNSDIEATTTSATAVDSQPDLSTTILGFCFASAIGFLVLHFQKNNDNDNKHIVSIPISVHLFGLLISCSFTAIFVSQFMAPNLANKLLKRIGFVFAALAFLLAVAIPSPLWLRILHAFIFLLGTFIVFKYGHITI